jgi:acetolactate synthase I/II/III large subunit
VDGSDSAAVHGREGSMNGAESLARALVAGGVDVCFANPGTSEMHFVAALDRVDQMRCILGLTESVVTGAADGYARMALTPAATLLHLGPGLANGLSNIHNARRAATPMVNIVGDHATHHRNYDAPLTSDIEGTARPFSDWLHTSKEANSVASDALDAINAARRPPGSIATLILPADTAWADVPNATIPAPVTFVPTASPPCAEAIRNARAALLSDEPCLLLLGGGALFQRGLDLAGRIASKSGAKLLATTFVARMERGAGRVVVDRLPYPPDSAVEVLRGIRHILLIHSKMPVAFFAYPGKPSLLAPPDVEVHVVAANDVDPIQALEWLAQEVDATSNGGVRARVAERVVTAPGSGAITPLALGASIGALLPENAIVVDEGVSTGRGFFLPTRFSPPHDWLQNMGGSIGIGLPLATGAALACPDRRVISLQADGSGMYTLQALWTQAREGLNITTVIFANRCYAILKAELRNVGAGIAGSKARSMLEIDRPTIDWVALARGLGVPAVRTETMEEFNIEFARSHATSGPSLIEAVV